MSEYRYDSNMQSVVAMVNRAIDQAVAETTAAVEAEAKLQVQAMVYDTPESPAYKRTGNLKRSIMSRLSGRTGVVAARADYAFFVHEGTRYMTPRPFLMTALRSQEAKLVERIRKYMR